MKKLVSCLLALVLTAALAAPMAGAAGYTDIPANGALAGEVRKAVDYGLMGGYSATRFGYSDPMTRAQFLTVLDRMMGWFSADTHVGMWLIPGTMEVSNSLSETYLHAIEQAAQRDVVDKTVPFRPNDAITRGEMAEMLVRALGLENAASSLNYHRMFPYSDTLHHTPFEDLPEGNEGYISVAYTIGMARGTSATAFSPNATATRAQAAAMLVRIYEKIHQETDFVHGFYAISSHSQLSLAEDMDAVSAGWSRMTWDGETALLATTSANNNEFAIPGGYDEVVNTLTTDRVPLNLSVFMDGQSLKDLLASEEGRTQAVEQIVNEMTVNYKALGRNPYSGVTIDFEGLRHGQKADFTTFLTELSREVHTLNKSLYVCVSPVFPGEYYDGYDYKAIASLADKFILMSYDYDARDMTQFVGTEYYKTAATAPIGQVYLGLKVLTDEVGECSKVALGFSCKNVAWKIDENNKLLSGAPIYPTSETVAKRLAQPDTQLGWSDEYQQSYAIYTTEDGSRYFLWYQDEKSVQMELQTAKLLDVTGVSLWRLGTIPTGADWNWNSLLS